jgi:hypothetical protein
MKDYDFEFEFGRGTDHTRTFLNEMVLYESTWRGLLHNPSKRADVTAVQTLYHEASHAYVDLEDIDDTKMWAEAVSIYKTAKLVNGKTVSDPAEAVEEAVAEYVGHRAAQVWFARDKMALVNLILDKFEARQLKADQMKEIIGNVLAQGSIPGSYNRAMLERVFGYQKVGGTQVPVAAEPIPDRLRHFCDTVILEDKIWDNFNFMPQLVSHYQQLEARLDKHLPRKQNPTLRKTA